MVCKHLGNCVNLHKYPHLNVINLPSGICLIANKKNPEFAPLSNRELVEENGLTDYISPILRFPPGDTCIFFAGSRSAKYPKHPKPLWATWKHSWKSADLASSRCSLLISDVASWKFHRHCHLAKFGCRRITGVVWTVLQLVGASARKSTQLVAPMGHHVLSCCLPSTFAG